MLEKFTVSRGAAIYEAFPDVALTRSGKLVCIFAECTHHADRSYTRLMLCDSLDRGRTWSPKRPPTDATRGVPYWNCGRISRLRDGRLAVIADKLFTDEQRATPEQCRNYLFFSADEGATWSGPHETPALGIVPKANFGFLVQRLWYSGDKGESWQGPVVVGREKGLNLCEASILPVNGALVAFMRENSWLGRDCCKAISRTGAEAGANLFLFPYPPLPQTRDMHA